MSAKVLRFPVFACVLSITCTVLGQGRTVILEETGFPHADTGLISREALRRGFLNAEFARVSELDKALTDENTAMLVLPYGSAYPETAWPEILRFLDRGGDLLVLGGKPFTRAAFKKGDAWALRAPSVAASLELFIADYQATSGSADLTFQPNTDVQPALPAFQWAEAFSPVVRLSAAPIVNDDIGTTGDADAQLTTLAWGSHQGHYRAAPALLIDHTRKRFVGGRWIFLAADLSARAFDDPSLLARLQAIGLRHGDRFTFRPRLPLFLPGEALEFQYTPAEYGRVQAGDVLKLTVRAEEGAPPCVLTVAADASKTITLPPNVALGKGLHTVDATLVRGGTPLWVDHAAFWMRDWNYLKSGPSLGVGKDYFLQNGKPLPVVGTTYMASDANRLFLERPNAYVWDRDMAQIRSAGLNMIRSGIWSAWRFLTMPDGTVSEDGLRTIEAFLMTARHNNLPVQFNLFAFLPNIFGGENAYLDPAALQAQDRYVRSIVGRFHDVPFLAWDVINEPSANANLWKTLPQNDVYEQAAWRKYLNQKYADQASLLALWSEPSFGIGRALQSKPTDAAPTAYAQNPFALPEPGAFAFDGVRSGYNPLKVYDYFLFTQGVFVDWLARQRATIRDAGSNQLVTVGQDEGGVSGRVSPAFFSPEVSFTADHTWWDFDSILWASLAAKMPGKPMLIQEMGEQRRLMQDDHLRLSAEEESWQLERKMATAFAQGAGGLEWVWNVNAMMANDNETTIGAIRPDGTEKPEADVLAGFAAFASKSPQSFTEIEPPPVMIVTSQALLYSGMNGIALAAQKKALRALAYYDHMPTRMLPENRVSEMGHPKLVILPAPQALTEGAWQQLLDYVARGGCLLVSGPVERDEHWQIVDRLSALHVAARLLPSTVRQSSLRLPSEAHDTEVTFPTEVQQAPLEVLHFADNASVQQITHGRGKILWSADPVEFAENYEPAAALYRFALAAAGVEPAFRQVRSLSPGVLAFPTVLKDAVLYSFSSESLEDTNIDLEDALTHARLEFRLRAQHGALVLVRRSDASIIGSYGVSDMQKDVQKNH